MTKYRSIIFIISAFILISCGKDKKDSTDILFEVNRATPKPLQLDGVIKSVVASSSGWGLAAPTASADFDCFGILVNYPERSGAGRCEKIDGSVIANPHRAYGLVGANQFLEGNVLVGEQRRFHVVGFDSSLGYCPNVNEDLGPYRANLSAPFLLGTAVQDIKLDTNIVNITASYAANKIFESCTFPQKQWEIPAFNPCSDLSGCKLWLDASDSNTLFSDDGCSTPYSAGTVGCITDKSGNGFNASNATGAQRPNYLVAGQNNRGLLSFNGSNQYLSTSLNPSTAFSTTTSAFIVVKPAAVGSNVAMLGSLNSTTYILGMHTGAPNKFNFDLGSGSIESTTAPIVNTAKIIAGVGTAGGSFKLFVNDVIENSTSAGGSMPNRTIYIGALNTGAPGNHFNGKIGEIILYNQALSNADALRVISYLKDKWGI
ncbi:MAG: LamG domain-containing protein [Oligoflexia bacterium]|nr:LamG domain-containing protein [Oligoflexia bacterium]